MSEPRRSRLIVLAGPTAVGKGSVERSWISRTNGGKSETAFSASKVKRLYANFTW